MTKFNIDMIKQIKKLARLGATMPEIADFFEVNRDTLYEWQKIHPEFKEALKDGRAFADAKVADALFKRATGYKHKAVKHFLHAGEVIEKEYIEIYAPDTTACIFWLKNRRPDLWRDQITTQTPVGEKPPAVTVEDRLKLIEASKTKKEA